MRERSVLIGAVRSGSVERLEEYIRRAGVRVERVGRGPEVIERALFARYDGVVLDTSLELLAAPQVRDLLKANPRTQMLPVLLVDLEGQAGNDDLYIAAPLSDLRWLDDVIAKPVEASGTRGSGALQARLDELALIDTLQMLIHNRREGLIELVGTNHVGRIELVGDRFGAITWDDTVGGLKALVRLVSLGEGDLRFEPRSGLQAHMEGSAEALLFEAVHLRDELAKYRALVPPGTRVLIKSGGERKLPNHGVLEEILLLVDFYGAVDDILERLEYPDAEILKGIVALRDDGWVELRVPEAGAGHDGGFADAQLAPSLRDERMPTVWLFGRDADVVRLLWADPRFKQRVLLRRSLRNPGRFGGNGWFLELGGNHPLWLRTLEPMAGAAQMVLRTHLGTAAGVFLLSEQDGDDLDTLISLAVDMTSAGKRAVWLPVEAAAGVEHTDAWIGAVAAELPGRLLPLSDDIAAGVWHAITVAVGPQQDDDG